MVGCKDQAEVRGEHVELAVLVGEVFDAPHVEPGRARPPPRARAPLVIGSVESIAVTGAPCGRPSGRGARAGGEVEPALARPRQLLEELLLNRPERRREPLVHLLVPEPHRGWAGVQAATQHTSGVGDLFERRPVAGSGGSRRSRRGCAHRTLDEFAGRKHVGRAGAGAASRDRGRSCAVTDPLRAAGNGEDDARADHRRRDGRRVRGAVSAVSATVANVREVLARARERLGATGRRTILFLDEIHRFNKAQQDALLPGVEDGSDPDRRHDRKPVLRGQLGPALAGPALRARSRSSARSSRSCGADAEASWARASTRRRGADRGRSGRRRASALGILELAADAADEAPVDRAGASRTPPASGRPTTAAATRTTTRSPRGSSRRAQRPSRPRSTTSR